MWRDHKRTIILVGAAVVLAGVVVFWYVQSPDRRHIRELDSSVPDRQMEAIGALAVDAAGAPPPPLDKDDIFAPYVVGVPKVTTVLSEETKDGVRVTKLRFASAEGSKEGAVKDCEIYAILARPADAAGRKLPGILVCHGGGGLAFEEGATAWAKLGYVAIIPDLPGYGANDKMQSISRVTKMQFGADQIIPLKPTPYVCVLFDGVVSGLHAFNLLAAQPDVDPQKLVMTGISWGGYMVTMLSGLLGDRVKAAFDLYGSGFYQLDAIGSDTLKKMDETDRNAWLKNFDAGTRLGRCRAAFLMYSATNDIFFKPPSVMATLDAIPGNKYFCFGPNKSHYMSLPGGPVRWEYPITAEVEPAFFAHVLAGNNPPLPDLSAAPVPRKGKTLKFTVKNCPDRATGWFYVSWLPDQPRGWEARDWARLEAARGKNGEFTCRIPESLGAFDWYGGITFTLKTGKIARAMSLSTKIYAGSAALAAEPAPDPRTTVLPTYVLSDRAAADGKLEEWATIPPSATATPGQFMGKRQTPATVAIELRCGMKKESNDLFVLVTVRDSHRYSEERPVWMVSDNLELFLDYGREARDTAFPEWWRDNNKYANVPEMAQFGLRPRTINGEACVIPAGSAKGWTIDYKSVLIEGGMAYEIRIDAASALGKLGLKQLPARIGFDILVGDQNYPLYLQTEGYSNEACRNYLFGEGMDFLYASLYGMVSLRPVAAPTGVQALPRTLEARYGFPTVEDVAKGVGVLAPDALADLVYWAGCNNVAFTEPLVAKLMTDPSPLVREACLAGLCFSKQKQPAVKAGIEAAYKELTVLSPAAVVLANMTNERYALGHAPRLHELLASPDITVAVSAARALAKVGTAEDIPVLDKALATALAGLATQKDAVGRTRAYNVWMKSALDELKNRTEPITIPAFTPTWQPKAENSDLPRLMPVSGNHVYNGRGLLRAWPKEGPRELWRQTVGAGKAAVTEVGGKAYTAVQTEGKQWALCLDPKTGATLWRTVISKQEWKHITDGPVVTPLVDDGRVYVCSKYDKNYNPKGVLVCLDAGTGTELWRSDGSYYAQNDATPLIVGDVLYLPAGREGQGRILVAVDKKSGKLLWGVKDPQKRQFIYGSSASPSYQIIDGKAQVIFGVYGDAREAWGIDAATGEVLWTYQTPMHHSLICSPVAEGSRVFLAGGQGQVSFSACLQMYIKDGKIRARQVYNSPLQCAMYNTAAILDGAVYSFAGKALQCTDFKTGALLWESKGKDWGNDRPLIVADGLIFALTKRGDLVLIEANQTGYKELGRVATKIKLGIPQQPTIANGRLYVRGDTTIVCYQVARK